MYYKFSKRRQKVWLRNVNRSLRTANDTRKPEDYWKHRCYIDSCMIQHPRVFKRLNFRTEVRLTKSGWFHRDARYYLKANKKNKK